MQFLPIRFRGLISSFNIKVSLILCLFFLSVQHSFSQPEFSFSSLSEASNDSLKFSTGIYSDIFLNSTVDNKFTGLLFPSDFLLSGAGKKEYITKEFKDQISGKLTSSNRVGGDVGSGLFFLHTFKRDSAYTWRYFLSLSDRMHLEATFPKDLFDLAFYGNKRFAGDTAFLDNTFINFLRYQQMQAGIIISTQKGNRYGLTLGFLKGEQNYSLKINRAHLFTSENGESLDVDFSAEINQTDSSNYGIDAFSGWGISSDFFGEFPIQIKEHKSFFRVEANDLGFIKWNKNSLYYNIDTSIHFEGFYFSNILELNDSVLQSISTDTIQAELQAAPQRKIYYSYLPSLMRLSWNWNLEKFFLSAGFFHRINSNYKPLTYLKYGYKFSSWFSAASRVSYGGYGKIGFGIETKFAVKNWSLRLGSSNLEGVIFPEEFGGNSVFFSLRKEF